MINYKNKKESGFTLIELLVVVAIIGLLASIVLVSLEESRQKARNSAKNQMAVQYVNAIELFRSENDSYPIFGDVSSDEYYCIGFEEGDTDSCFELYDNLSGDTLLNESLESFFGGKVPKDNKEIITTLGDLKGFIYACESDAGCSSFEMVWALEGVEQECGNAGTPLYESFFGTTVCRYQSIK